MFTARLSCTAKVVRWGYRQKCSAGRIISLPTSETIEAFRRELANHCGKSTPDNHEAYMVKDGDTTLFVVFSDNFMCLCQGLDEGDSAFVNPTGDLEILS